MLAVTGGKGGVGKTTTALGVARALGRRGEAVLAVDVDRDLPDLARTAGVDTVRVGGADAAGGRPDPDCPSVRVLTGPRDGDEARRLLAALAQRPERVVLDCPAGSGPAATDPLAAADRSLVVSTPDPASLRDAAKTVAIARTLDAPPSATVLNRCDAAAAAVERLLPAPQFAVPRVIEPLEARRARTRFEDLSEFATLRKG